MQKIKKRVIKTVSTFVIGLAIVAAGAYVLAPTVGAVKCTILPSGICDAADTKSTDVKDNAIFQLLKVVLQIMTAGVGVAALQVMKAYDRIQAAFPGGGGPAARRSWSSAHAT